MVLSASRVFAYLNMTFMHCLLTVTTFQNVHQCRLSIGSSCDVEKLTLLKEYEDFILEDEPTQQLSFKRER